MVLILIITCSFLYSDNDDDDGNRQVFRTKCAIWACPSIKLLILAMRHERSGRWT